MNTTHSRDSLTAHAQHVMGDVYLPRILSCLEQLTPEQIWWRPNEASNSVGNLVLHLAGNVRQWIISGLGGATDQRQRDLEFSERGPLPRRVLASRLRRAVEEACRVLGKLSPEELARVHTIQKFRVTGLGSHVSRRRTLLPPRGANHLAHQDADGTGPEVHPAARARKRESAKSAGACSGAAGCY